MNGGGLVAGPKRSHLAGAPATGWAWADLGSRAARFYPNDSFMRIISISRPGGSRLAGTGALLLLVVAGVRLARSSLMKLMILILWPWAWGSCGTFRYPAHNAVENIFEVPMMATYLVFPGAVGSPVRNINRWVKGAA